MSDSPLENYLERELGEARQDSSGAFTLSPTEALRKLAGFQLPDKQSWACKVVQAAVAAGATGISLRLLEREAVFSLSGPIAWEIEAVEQALLSPEPGPLRCLWHLKQGLWSVGLHEGRPFWLQGAGWPQSLLWDGQALSRQDCPLAQKTVLWVSHARHDQPKGLAYYLGSGFSSHNADLLKEMLARCFVCPVPLDVDALRIDALQNCPGQGNSAQSYLLQVGFSQSGSWFLGVPAHTSRPPGKQDSAQDPFKSGYQPPANLPELASLIILLAAHLGRGRGKDSYQVSLNPCSLYWVLDGVVVERQALPFTERACSFGLIASAEGLSLDVSGFRLRQTPELEERINGLLLEAWPFVRAGSADFSHFVADQKEQQLNITVALGAFGAGIIWFFPPFGAMVLGLSAASHLLRSDQAGQLVSGLQDDLRLLQLEWEKS
ncbi:MAG: hypothetical protein U0931_27350 [Vulcanimicrobiota bacterium]